MPEKRWLSETLFDDLGLRMSYAVENVLYEEHTEHQRLVLFEHKHFGKMLMLDGATQVTAHDEFIYHEMMTHVPILAHGKAKNVLIIGGGDCGIAEEALKHKALKSVVQVEIDESVVEFSKEHFPEFTRPVFRDKRFESVIDDGMKYVAKTDRRFDVIIVDSTDPQGPGKVLFSTRFYAANFITAVAQAGNQHKWNEARGRIFLHRAAKVVTGFAGHHDVGEDQVRGAPAYFFFGLVGAGGGHDVIAADAEKLAHQPGDARLIVNHKNARRSTSW